MSTDHRAPPASHHLTDDCVHLVPRERSQGLGADIPGCGEAQESCRRGLVIRGFADQYNVVVPQGPVDVLDRDPASTSRLLEGVIALRGVLRRADALVSEAREHDEARHGDPPAPRPATPEGTRILARIGRVADPIPQRRPSRVPALIGYSPLFSAHCPRAADYVDKILKGTKPSELPVE